MTRYRRLTPSISFRPPRSRSGAAVLLGDLGVITVLITIGLLSHNIPDPWQYPAYTASRIAPFAIGWLLVAPLFGLFDGDRLQSYRAGVVHLIPAWIGAALVGVTVRAVGTSGGAGPVFFAVMAGFGLLFLLSWRLAVVTLSRRMG